MAAVVLGNSFRTILLLYTRQQSIYPPAMLQLQHCRRPVLHNLHLLPSSSFHALILWLHVLQPGHPSTVMDWSSRWHQPICHHQHAARAGLCRGEFFIIIFLSIQKPASHPKNIFCRHCRFWNATRCSCAQQSTPSKATVWTATSRFATT